MRVSPRRPRSGGHPGKGARPSLDPRPLAPDPTAPIPAVFLKAKTYYPIIYRKRIAEVDSSARAGDLVAVYSPDRELQGYGLFNPRSEVWVRMIRYGEELPDDAFWQSLLARAVHLRREVLSLDTITDAYRVVHAEADDLSGLVVDRFGDVLSAEVFSIGMYQRAPEILKHLQALCGTRHTLIQGGPHILAQEGTAVEARESEGLPRQVVIQEHGTRMRVRFQGGHKTGFFCDQRDNRDRLAKLCKGRSVLDLCCYTGGFSVQAKARGGASDVIGVDLDKEPLELAKENANLNQCRVKFVQADAFTYMRDRLAHGHRFDVVVLDPPKLIRNRNELEEGTRKHLDLNRLAMRLVAPNGILLTCSCAGLLPETEFLELVTRAARQSGSLDEEGRGTPRRMRILHKWGAPPDHPVASHCRETEYLKTIWLQLE